MLFGERVDVQSFRREGEEDEAGQRDDSMHAGNFDDNGISLLISAFASTEKKACFCRAV